LTLPADAPVAYITQTTLSGRYKDIIAAFSSVLPIFKPDIRDICYATRTANLR